MREVKNRGSQYSISPLCRLFGKSRQSFYQMEKRRTKERVEDEIVLVYIRDIRKIHPRIGTRKLHFMLRDVLKSNDIKMGRDKLFELLKTHDLLVKSRRKYHKTTNSNHMYWQYPNLIKNYVPASPEQIWASDITYLSTEKGFAYLSLVTDQYSKKIMGYHLCPTLEAYGPLEALKMALKHRSYPKAKLIHHSDRGIQYCCKEYIEALKVEDITISMSAKGNPYDNAIAERVNGILKSEYYLDRCFSNYKQAYFCVKNTISVYNNLRPHGSCNYLTPKETHGNCGALKKRWKHYKSNKKYLEPKPIGKEVKKLLQMLNIKEVLT